MKNRPSILDNSLSKCYQIVWNIIDEWVDLEDDNRTKFPSPTSETEKTALKYVSIERIVAANHSGAAHPIVDDEQLRLDKADAMVRAAEKRDSIQVRKVEDECWSTATKLEGDDWYIVDGKNAFKVASESLLGNQWVINVDEEVEDDRDNKVRQSKFRKAKEKDDILTRLAKLGGQEERNKEILRRFEIFNALPSEDRTFIRFEGEVLDFIKKPSDHKIHITLDGEEHVMETAIHEQGSAAMQQIVTRCILQDLIRSSEERAKANSKKKSNRKGKVGKVRKGSDGFRKCFQIDQQHLADVEEEAEFSVRQKESIKKKLLLRWNAGESFIKSIRKKKVWDKNDFLDVKKINGCQAANIIQFFAIPKCSTMKAVEKVQKVKEMQYSKESFQATRKELEASLASNGIDVDDIGKLLLLNCIIATIQNFNKFLFYNFIDKSVIDEDESKEDESKEDEFVEDETDEEKLEENEFEEYDSEKEESEEEEESDICSSSEGEDGEESDPLENEEYIEFDPYIGMRVKKQFNDGKFYVGEVISDPSLVWDKNQRREIEAWTVKYSDGELEDMYKDELYKWRCSDVQFNAEEKEIVESFFEGDELALNTFYSECEGEDDTKLVQELKDECLKRGISFRRTWGKKQMLQCLKSTKL